MWLARTVLAILPIVAPPVVAVSEPHEADLSSQIDVIPMAWRVEREDDAGSGERSCFLISWGVDVIVRLHKPDATTAATWFVLVGFDNEPGSVRYLRINRKYFTTAEHQIARPLETARFVRNRRFRSQSSGMRTLG